MTPSDPRIPAPLGRGAVNRPITAGVTVWIPGQAATRLSTGINPST